MKVFDSADQFLPVPNLRQLVLMQILLDLPRWVVWVELRHDSFFCLLHHDYLLVSLSEKFHKEGCRVLV
jgi:hypothetical protein